MFKKIISNIFIIIAILLLLYPAFSDVWNRMHNATLKANYDDLVQELTETDYSDIISAAQDYNTRLATKTARFYPNEEEMKEYNQLLNIGENGLIGYIKVKKIGVDMPIYHTIEDTVLQVGAGHVPGSSLPVEGESTHVAISGHTGMSTGKMFTDLTKMEIGDTFELTVLGTVYVYEVDAINKVLPDELDLLDIEEGQQLCTLITCTPFGVNSHRLLVRGHLIETKAEEKETTETVTETITETVNIFSEYEKYMMAAALLLILIYYVVRPVVGHIRNRHAKASNK